MSIQTINDNCEAFDWAWAFYYYLSHWHSGIYSDEHIALSKLISDYKLSNVPDIDVDDNDCDEYEMAVEFYHQLNTENWQEQWGEFCRYMDDEWDNDDY